MNRHISNILEHGLEVNDVIVENKHPLRSTFITFIKTFIISLLALLIANFIAYILTIQATHRADTDSTSLVIEGLIVCLLVSLVVSIIHFALTTYVDESVINRLRGFDDLTQSYYVFVKDNEIALPYQFLVPGFDLNSEYDLTHESKYYLNFANYEDWELTQVNINSINYDNQLKLNQIEEVTTKDITNFVENVYELNKRIIDVIHAKQIENHHNTNNIISLTKESKALDQFISTLKDDSNI